MDTAISIINQRANVRQVKYQLHLLLQNFTNTKINHFKIFWTAGIMSGTHFLLKNISICQRDIKVCTSENFHLRFNVLFHTGISGWVLNSF